MYVTVDKIFFTRWVQYRLILYFNRKNK